MPPILNQDGVPTASKEDDCSIGTLYNQSSNAHYTNSKNERNVTFSSVVTEVTNLIKADRKSFTVIGITLLDERGIGKNRATAERKSIVLGGVCVENVKINAEELRRLMCSELPSIPASFNFLTKDGWPVCRQQERRIKADYLINEQGVICIQKQFEKQRIGVIDSEGVSAGFVFANINCNVRQLRDVIEQQLKLSLRMKTDYRFIERNGWPVTLTQETVLSVMDIISGCNVCIKGCDKLNIPNENTSDALVPCEESNKPVTAVNISPDVSDGERLMRKLSSKFGRSEKHLSIKNRKGSERLRCQKGHSVNPILISYVRAEAAKYALDLKKEIVQMGFSVYLDVHEIKTGTDWQDDLNFAVTNCYMFVPLITPRYGKTQWTNREIKLADVLGKLIIPVNFMESWPPACLAIQFAATQYIPWKSQDSDRVQGEKEKPFDPRMWDSTHVKRVSKQIADCYRENYHKWPVNSKVISPHASRPFGSLKLRDDRSSLSGQELTADESKQLIVISVHPCQKHIALDLKTLLEKEGHQVWCSVDLQDTQDNLCLEDGNLANPDTPHDLPPIPEGEVFFNQNDTDTYSSLGENKTSLPMYKDGETYGKQSAYRLMSDISDIRNVAGLTQDKISRLSTFQEKVDQAGVVIALISEVYTRSVFSQQQVFYCEQRKRVVLVKCDNSAVPKWFRLLMGNDIIMRDNNPQFECVLKSRVKRSLNPTTSETPKDATAEAKVNYLVNFLMKNLPLQDKCVYIAGSSKLQTQRSEEICRAIGRELAKLENVSIVTGGFYGAADITAKTFFGCKGNNVQCMLEDSPVVHILPMHDSEDLSSKCRQNPDGSFEAVPYGKTVFLGDSVKERETVVARLLDTCIVIEGGPGVVHEVEEFIWNDHFVISIISTGGAAGGLYGVPVKIFEIPPGVDEADWSVLSNKEANPEEVAKAVVYIMASLKKTLASPSSSIAKPSFSTRKSRKASKSWKKSNSKKYDCSAAGKETDETSSFVSHTESEDTMRNHFETLETSEGLICKKCRSRTVKQMKWWQKIF